MDVDTHLRGLVQVGVRGSLSRDILSLRTMSRGWVAEEVLVHAAASLAGGGPCVGQRSRTRRGGLAYKDPRG